MSNINLIPRIFIGSSKEGLEVAEFVKQYLSDFSECFLWTDDIFKYNKSFFDTLLQESCLFDFGILIATKDDFLESREQLFETPRDNVVFEFGLFLGRLGPNRSFILQEKEAKLPSDLLGISIPSFQRVAILSESESLIKELEKIKGTIQEKIKLGELGLLPSTALAIGYFYNFVAKVCESLHSMTAIEFEGKKYSEFEFNIIIPKTLSVDLSKNVRIYTQSNKLQEYKINTPSRSYPLFVNYEQAEYEILRLYDLPTTLSGTHKAIELFLAKSHIGKDQQQQLMEQRELNNFKLVLNNLIQSDPYTKNNVNLIDE